MGRVCEVSGKKTRFGNKVSRRGMAKSKGGVGIKLTGITRRKFKVNLQKIRVILPDWTVKRMRVAASVIRNGWITTRINGKMQRVPLVKAARGRNRRRLQAENEELQLDATTLEQADEETTAAGEAAEQPAEVSDSGSTEQHVDEPAQESSGEEET